MRISIVIVSWNTRQMLADCLDSVYAHPPDGDFDLWVVDNASNDGSSTMVRERFHQVHLIESSENLGFARANNRAIRQSQGEYTVLLNPDTVVCSGALETLARFMDENPRTGGAGPYLLNQDGSLQVSCYPIPTLGREFWRLFYLDTIFPFGIYAMERWDTNRPRTVGVLKGACMFLRRAALDQVGLMDEDYFMYTEEVDLCYRLNRGGWPLYWVPQARVVHFGGQSVEQVATEMFMLLYQTKVLYFRKNHSLAASRLYKAILSAAILPRLAAGPMALLKRAPKRARYQQLAQDYLQLLRLLPGM